MNLVVFLKQLYILVLLRSIALPPNCNHLIEGNIFLSNTYLKFLSISPINSGYFLLCISFVRSTISLHVSRLFNSGINLAYFVQTIMSDKIWLLNSIVILLI